MAYYQVGHQCVTYNTAQNIILSSSPLFINSDGSVIRPIYKNNSWYLGESEIKLSFPECSPKEQIFLGAKVGSGFVTLIIVIWLFKLVFEIIRSSTKVNSYDD